MEDNKDSQLSASLSPAFIWALSIGTSVGWGSLVVTANTYLVQAGPWGTVAGILTGALVMLIIARNYSSLIRLYPNAGGAYAYVRETFGYDHGFLTAWFLALTYLAMLWANATSLPLFAHYFLGDTFRVVRLYSLFGYDIYLGEILLVITAILINTGLCMRWKRASEMLMIGLVGLFTLGIAAVFLLCIFRPGITLSPGFLPDSHALSQVFQIAMISPWAFIGFENVSHASEEFAFPRSRIFRIMIAALLTTTLLYVLVTLLSVTAYPPEYASWLDYIRDLGNLDGIRALPAFYAARHYLGEAGVWILMLSLFALILTSLIGNTTALSRLFYALAKDRVLPGRFARLNRRHVPARAMGLICILSCLIPFLGRTAISWIVDVTTLGAIMIYGFVSAAALKAAREAHDRTGIITGTAGLVLMLGFGAYLLIPNLFATGTMATESYFLFVVWAVLGFFFFHAILRHDQHRRFGKSIIVWIALLSLVLFVSLVWMNQSIMNATDRGLSHILTYYQQLGLESEPTDIISSEMRSIRQINTRSILVVVGVFALSLSVLLNNYSLMSRRAHESELALNQVRNVANTDPLTGVKSKHAYAEREMEINALIQEANMEHFAVAVCDVNGLKHVNDTQGHQAGDAYIRSACHMICELFMHSPVYRTGGDEFVILLTGRDYESRHALMQALHDTSVAHIASGEVVVSGGISDYEPGTDVQLKTVFERADARMYQEKKALKDMGARTR